MSKGNGKPDEFGTGAAQLVADIWTLFRTKLPGWAAVSITISICFAALVPPINELRHRSADVLDMAEERRAILSLMEAQVTEMHDDLRSYIQADKAWKQDMEQRITRLERLVR